MTHFRFLLPWALGAEPNIPTIYTEGIDKLTILCFQFKFIYLVKFIFMFCVLSYNVFFFIQGNAPLQQKPRAAVG